jgi:hypothetical protein
MAKRFTICRESAPKSLERGEWRGQAKKPLVKTPSRKGKANFLRLGALALGQDVAAIAHF